MIPKNHILRLINKLGLSPEFLKAVITPLQGGHILAHFKVDVIKQPLDNNFDKTSAQIQVGLNNPKLNTHIHGYTLQSNLLLPLLLLLSL